MPFFSWGSQKQTSKTLLSYDSWRKRYVREDGGGLYVLYNEDGSSSPKNAVTVSEASGYGSLSSCTLLYPFVLNCTAQCRQLSLRMPTSAICEIEVLGNRLTCQMQPSISTQPSLAVQPLGWQPACTGNAADTLDDHGLGFMHSASRQNIVWGFVLGCPKSAGHA